MRTKLFIDFWNFQLDWNRVVGKDGQGNPIRIPWSPLLPTAVLNHLCQKHGTGPQYDGTHVYASVEPGGDTGLRQFLQRMDSFPGYAVTVKERKANNKPLHCKNCDQNISHCPKCQQKIRRTVEKGIDAAIITELMSMAHDDVYDIAILASGDADLIQAVKFIQERTRKRIYNLWFSGIGVSLRNACWDHIPMNELFTELGVTL